MAAAVDITEATCSGTTIHVQGTCTDIDSLVLIILDAAGDVVVPPTAIDFTCPNWTAQIDTGAPGVYHVVAVGEGASGSDSDIEGPVSCTGYVLGTKGAAMRKAKGLARRPKK